MKPITQLVNIPIAFSANGVPLVAQAKLATSGPVSKLRLIHVAAEQTAGAQTVVLLTSSMLSSVGSRIVCPIKFTTTTHVEQSTLSIDFKDSPLVLDSEYQFELRTFNGQVIVPGVQTTINVNLLFSCEVMN